MASRMRSPMAVPPGSRVTSGSMPRLRSHSAKSLSWLLLPAPSGPSQVMNQPRAIAVQDSHNFGDVRDGGAEGILPRLQALPDQLGSQGAPRLHGDGLQIPEAAVDRRLR